jgi:hypothetical protein
MVAAGHTSPSHCAMVCDPESPSILGHNGCPGPETLGGVPLPPIANFFVATCEKIESIGICMYPMPAGFILNLAGNKLEKLIQ